MMHCIGLFLHFLGNTPENSGFHPGGRNLGVVGLQDYFQELIYY